MAVNITRTDGTGSGELTAYPDDEPAPSTSKVDCARDQGIATAAVVVDMVGYHGTDGKSAYLAVSPFRYLDTRSPVWKDGLQEPHGCAAGSALDLWNLGKAAGPTALVSDIFGYYQNDCSPPHPFDREEPVARIDRVSGLSVGCALGRP